MGTWFTSDTHFGHANIIKYCDRPFNSVPEMNEELIYRWNRVVQPDDKVYHLGDAVMGQLTENLPLIGRLNGYKILVAGNHDKCSPAFKGFKVKDSFELSANWVPTYLEFFQEVHQMWTAIPDFGGLTLSHFPSDDERYAAWCLPDAVKDYPQICGHVHTSWTTKDRKINVGVDQWDFTPVSMEQIEDWVTKL